MTTQWGSFSGGLRCGIDVTNITTPTNGSTTCVVTCNMYVGTSGSQTFADNQAGHMSQSGGSSISSGGPFNYFNNLNQNQTMLVASGVTVTYTYSDYGVGHSVTINANADGLFNGGTPSVSINVSIPARPWANPAAVTASGVARVSDTQQTVSWTNHDTASAAYQNLKIYRKTDAGSFALISTIGVVSSTSDTTTSANHKYRYRPDVLGKNGSQTAGPETGDVWTTPGTPTSLVATKLAGGDIRLTWTNNVNYSEYTVRIEESQNGGAYSELTSVAAGTTTWDHVAPSTSVTHKYRIRARTSSGTTLNSSYSNESATIVLLSTAGAPTGLAPSGNSLDANEAIVFTWIHNPTDGTPQTKYQLQYKIDAGSFVTVGPTTSGVSSFTMTAATLTNAHTITWHVATAAENGTIGAYSADSVFTTRARPTSTISQPSGGTWSLSQLVANWTYFQAQSSAQTAWHAYLYHKISGTFVDAVLVGEKSGSGATATVTFDSTTLLDGETYGVRVYVTSADGLTSIDSGTDLEEFTVAYLPPADATLTATYDADNGQMVIMITGSAAVGGVTEPIDTVDLQRQINGGEWVTWVTGIVLPGTLVAIVIDTMPTIRGSNNYRAVVRSATPSSVLSAEVENVTAEQYWGFLTTGPSFDQRIRIRARLETGATVGRDKAIYQFAGREDPVELSGEAKQMSVAVAGVLYPPSRGGMSSEPQDLEELGQTPGIVLWRDFTGRRIFSSLSDVHVGYNNDLVLYPVTFTVTRVSYDENVG